jgi:hypothetical protein
MNAITAQSDFVRCRAIPQAAPSAVPRRRGILRRLYEAVTLSCQRRAERDMGRLLAQSGGRLTDDIERRMTEQLIRNGHFGR